MLNLLLKEPSFKKGSVVIEIENNFQKSVHISRDTILLDGFTSNKFSIIDKSTNSTVEYKGKSIKYRPKKIELKEYEKLESELDLKEGYDLEDCHRYEVSFKTTAITEEGLESLSGIINIEMEC